MFLTLSQIVCGAAGAESLLCTIVHANGGKAVFFFSWVWGSASHLRQFLAGHTKNVNIFFGIFIFWAWQRLLYSPNQPPNCLRFFFAFSSCKRCHNAHSMQFTQIRNGSQAKWISCSLLLVCVLNFGRRHKWTREKTNFFTRICRQWHFVIASIVSFYQVSSRTYQLEICALNHKFFVLSFAVVCSRSMRWRWSHTLRIISWTLDTTFQ